MQGLRAIAVLLVVAYHSGVSWLSGGYVGVDVFFVISGFLITTSLLETLEAHGRIPFGQFYAKRARRILPAALLVAALTVLASLLWVSPLLMGEVVAGARAVALYVPNLLFAARGTDYLAETMPSVFQHYWSLGIEEQFYLLWPAALGVGFWLFRRSERRLLVMTAVLTLASFVLCVVWMDVSQPWAFFSLPTRAWELGAGALVAFLLRSGARFLQRPTTGLLAWAGLALLLGVSLLYEPSTPFPGYTAALPVLATMLLIVGGAAPGREHANRLLGLAPFQFVGAISYSLYLVHWPLQMIPQHAVGEVSALPAWQRLALGAVAFPLAWLLYRYVERPVIAWPVLRHRSKLWTGAAAVIASLALIATASGAAQLTAARPMATAQQVTEEEQPAPEPVGTDVVPANLTPSLEDVRGDNPSIYDDGCHRPEESTDAGGCRIGDNPEAPLVFLFGDSHAAAWFPALEKLAEEGKIRLDTNTKNSCHSAQLEKSVQGVPYTECEQWRQGVLERIDQEQPDLVLLGDYASEDTVLVEGNEELPERWRQGMLATIERIDGPNVAVLADTPDQGGTPAVCLSQHLEAADECATGVDEAFHPELTESVRTAAEQGGAQYVDLTEYFCNDATCPVIIGNTQVYRDGHHLAAHYSEKLTRPLWEELSPALR